MKIIIEWSEVKTTSTGKEYKAISFKDESGAEVKASVWSDAPFYAQIAPGAMIEAEIRKTPDGKYTNLVAASQPRGNSAGMMAMKEKSIEKFQNTKATQIAAAQDRSAWMWAKTNASTLLASRKTPDSIQGIADTVIHLATLIYNGEPTEPFSSPEADDQFANIQWPDM